MERKGRRSLYLSSSLTGERADSKEDNVKYIESTFLFDLSMTFEILL